MHVEMTSSFVQYDVGNLFNSYLGTLLGPISIVCCVEVSHTIVQHVVWGRGLIRTCFLPFL